VGVPTLFELFSTTKTKMRFQEPTRLELFLEGFQNFVSAWDCYTYNSWVGDKFIQEDFWFTLSSGWMQEYIYPYDDPFQIKISQERKLRLGK
jgi:hypothetical protein